MALVVDDTPDVWVDDLANLCLVRRFVGDLHDDGLMQLSGNLTDIHSRFYPAGTSYSFDDTHCNPPDVRDVLHQLRGSELLGCKMALTGEPASGHLSVCNLRIASSPGSRPAAHLKVGCC